MDDVVYISPSTGRTVKALLFDVFGTVVDWRTSMTRRIQRFANRYTLNVNAEDLADQWRSLYQPAMERIRSGRREFVLLDQLHRENLSAVLADNGLVEDNFDAADLECCWSTWPATAGFPGTWCSVRTFSGPTSRTPWPIWEWPVSWGSNPVSSCSAGEHGPNQARDLVPEQDWDASVEEFPALDRVLRA